MGSIGSKTTTAPDAFGGYLGERNDEDRIARLSRAQSYNIINPHHDDGIAFHKNCALCSVAVVLQALGYDVEAMERDMSKDSRGRDIGWRGFNSVFDVDWSDKDNYILSGSNYQFTGYPDVYKDAMGRNTLNYKNSTDPNTNISVKDVPRMPKSPNKAAQAIVDKVEKWGPGAVGQMSVWWKGRNSSHAINILNVNGTIKLYDGQTNMVKAVGKEQIARYLSSTVANRTSIVRLDNAKIKAVPLLKAAGIEKMVKKSTLSAMLSGKQKKTQSLKIDEALNKIDWSKF